MNKRTFSLIIAATILILLLVACSNKKISDSIQDQVASTEAGVAAIQANAIVEHTLVEIPLPGGLASAAMEYSGLGWYGQNLILLPQYPNGINGNKDGFLYAIGQDSLTAFLEDPSAKISVSPIPFYDAGLSNHLEGFEGFEAIVFIEDSVFLTIETHGGDPMRSFIVKGMVESTGNVVNSIKLDESSLVELTVQNDNSNASYEALTSDGEYIYAFFEQNGSAQNKQPYSIRLDLELKEKQEMPLDSINYRVTDATLMDKDGSFWMVNYYFPGDTHLAVDEDPISISYGLGESHQNNEPVERLAKFDLTQKGIVLSDEPPIYLKLLENDEARNWEGLAAFGDNGFLLITDKFPGSILAYLRIR